jgi:dihydrofolate reductase
MITAIVAVDKAGGIGKNNSMPWPTLREDLKFFKLITTNNIVIMGSNTWRSLPGKLSNRINVVISSTIQEESDYTYTNVDQAIFELSIRYPDKDIVIIGGQQLYDATLHLVDRVFLTEIDDLYKCDRFFNVVYVKENLIYSTIHNIVEKTEVTPRYTIKEYYKRCSNI